MDAAEMRGGYTFSFQSQQKTIDRNLAEAEKDNSFIYHAKVCMLKYYVTDKRSNFCIFQWLIM